MKKFLLTLLVGGCSITAFGQGIVLGLSPASVQRSFVHSYADPNAQNPSWGQNSFHTTFVEGFAVFVNDGTAGNDVNGHPNSQQGCTALTNAADISGKIAIIRRGTCNFGLKAKAAFNAGAIGIIVINNLDESISMSGGTDGLDVTVPVVSMSLSEGQIIATAMAAGPVELLLGNKKGYFSTDLGFVQADVLSPRYLSANTLLDGANYSYPVGLMINNYGSAASSTAKAKITISKVGTTAPLYEEELGPFTLASGDSLHLFPGATNAFPAWAGTNLTTGDYTIKFELNGDVADDFASDNTITQRMVVSANEWAVMDLKAGEAIKDVAVFTKSGTPAPNIEYCSMFRHANASNVAATGVKVSTSVASDATVTLDGQAISAILYKWNNGFTNIDHPDFNFSLLENIAEGEFIITTAVNSADVVIPYFDPVVLEDNQRYLSCIVATDESLYYGYTDKRNVNRNYNVEKEVVNPLRSSNWYTLGFGHDRVLYNVLQVIDAATVSVDATTFVEGSAFPNPATDFVRINVAKNGDAVVNLTDLAGRTVSSQSVSFNGNQTVLDLTSVQSGMYIVNVVFQDGKLSKFNVVKN